MYSWLYILNGYIYSYIYKWLYSYIIPISVSFMLILLEEILCRVPLQEPSTLNSLMFLLAQIHLMVAVKGKSTISDTDSNNWTIAVFLGAMLTCKDFFTDNGTEVIEMFLIWLQTILTEISESGNSVSYS